MIADRGASPVDAAAVVRLSRRSGSQSEIEGTTGRRLGAGVHVMPPTFLCVGDI